MFLLAMGIMFVLLLANGNAQFGHGRIMQPPWPQSRQDVPGWAALHMSYIDKIAQASAGQVGSSAGPVLFNHQISIPTCSTSPDSVSKCLQHSTLCLLCNHFMQEAPS